MRNKFMLGAASAAIAAFAFAATAAAQNTDPPGDASTQARVTPGQEITGAIDAAGDIDWYRLNAQQGQRYRITLDAAPAGEGGGAIDPVLSIHSADGEVLAFNDDSGGTLNSALLFAPRASGEVFVAAQDYSNMATGGYVLRISAEPLPADPIGADVRTRGRIAAGQSVNGELEYEGDADWYRLNARAGQIYRIALRSNTQSPNALGDPYLRVYNASGEEVAYNDDGGDGYDSYLEYAPTRSGAIFLSAGAFADAYAGAYTLSVEAARLPADPISADVRTRGRLQLGQAVDGMLDYPGDRDWYRIRLTGGEVYRLSLNAAGENPQSDPLLRLYDAQGREVAMDDDSGGGLNSMLEYLAPTTGDYFVEARGFTDGDQGGYRLLARQGDIPADASTDAVLSAQGDFREGVLAPAGDRDWYRIDLEAGQSLRIALTVTGTADSIDDPYLVLYGPDSEEVARDDDGGEGLNSWLEYQARVSGPHYLEARGYSPDAAGRYFIGIAPGEIGADPETAEYINPNSMGRVSHIGVDGDVDWFGVELVEGRPYRFRLQGTGESPLADPLLTLYDSQGRQVAQDDDGGPGLSSYLYYASPTGGPHYAAVSSYGDTGTGAYHIDVVDTETPGNIYTDDYLEPGGDSRISRIEMPGDLDYFRVELTAGVAYQIDLRGYGEHPLADPFLTLLDSNDQRLTSDDDSGPGLDARLRFTPQRSDIYYIQASGLGGSVGMYQVEITRR